MLALLQTLVNTDSGSYDKPGVDAVGGHIREFPRRARHRQRGHAGREVRRRHLRHRRAGSPPLGNRPILLMGHRDTVFPKGEPTRRPFKIEGDRAYGPGRRRHEVRPGDELLRARRDQEVRRRAGAGDGAVHRRRGDRLAVLAPGDRAACPRGAGLLQLRAGPGARRRGDRPQGLPVHPLRDHRQGRALRRQFRGGHQRDQRTRAQDAGAACAERSEEAASRSMSAWCPAGRPSTP